MNILGSINNICKYNQNIVIVYTTTAALLASAIVWVDASDNATILDANNAQVVTGGTTVSKWLNKNNTNDYFLAQNSLTFTYSNTFYTSYKAIQSNNSTSFMLYSNPSSLPYLNYSLFFVATTNSSSGLYYCIGLGNGTGGGQNLECGFYNSNYLEWDTYGSNLSYTGSYNHSIPAMTDFIRTTVSNGDAGYLYGTKLPSGSNNGPVNQTTTELFFNLFSTFGSTNSSTMPSGSAIAEVVLFSSSLPDNYRQMVEGYLSWKYGLQTQLPTTHPYYSAPPP